MLKSQVKISQLLKILIQHNQDEVVFGLDMNSPFKGSEPLKGF